MSTWRDVYSHFLFFFVNVIKREFLFLILVGETFSPTVSCDEWRLLPRHFFFFVRDDLERRLKRKKNERKWKEKLR